MQVELDPQGVQLGLEAHQVLQAAPKRSRHGADVKSIGGRGGIRTHDALTDMPVFKTGAFNRSATLPAENRRVRGGSYITRLIKRLVRRPQRAPEFKSLKLLGGFCSLTRQQVKLFPEGAYAT